MSYDYWQKQFAGDPGTVGCVITLGGIQTKIVGMVPRGLRIPFGEFDIYAPQVTAITFLSGEQMQRGAGFLKVIARSRSGVSFEQVREALRVIDKDYHERAHENMDGDVVSRAAPLRESASDRTRCRLHGGRGDSVRARVVVNQRCQSDPVTARPSRTRTGGALRPRRWTQPDLPTARLRKYFHRDHGGNLRGPLCAHRVGDDQFFQSGFFASGRIEIQRPVDRFHRRSDIRNRGFARDRFRAANNA